MRTIALAGLGATLFMILLFSLLWILDIRKRRTGRLTSGHWANAFGFGLLPGISAWKAFDAFAGSAGGGKPLFQPLRDIPWLTADGLFVPGRAEFCAAVLLLAGVIIWLIVRKKDLPGNGDVLITVLCLWGTVRNVTEGLRAEPPRTGPFSLVILLAVATELICLGIWTVRRGQKQKSAVMTALEWIAVTGCGVLILLQEAGILSMGSEIANFAASAGCALLAAALILSAGRDSREA
jgi:hypothetical protein